ncbi:HAD family hydrolase [Micromonospora sp. NPDC004704]
MALLPEIQSPQVLLLDVGGVLLASGWELIQEHPGAATDLGEITGPFSEGRDKDWILYQSLRLSEHEYWERWSAKVRALTDPIKDIYTRAADPVRHAVVREALTITQGGAKVLAVSNGISRRIGAEWYRAQEELRGFELIDAATVGARKPSTAFFQACAEVAGVPMSDLVLIDDNLQYALDAAVHGLFSYHFEIGHSMTCRAVRPAP